VSVCITDRYIILEPSELSVISYTYKHRSQRNSGHAKEFFTFEACEKWGETKKVEGRAWGRGKMGTLATKPLDLKKLVCP